MTVQILHTNDSTQEAIETKCHALLKARYLQEIDWKPFHTCKARTCKVEYDGQLYTLLMSYKTLAAYECCGVVSDVLRVVYGYTATSAKHISKFAKDTGAYRIDRYMA